jgi:hypothetical protein
MEAGTLTCPPPLMLLNASIIRLTEAGIVTRPPPLRAINGGGRSCNARLRYSSAINVADLFFLLAYKKYVDDPECYDRRSKKKKKYGHKLKIRRKFPVSILLRDTTLLLLLTSCYDVLTTTSYYYLLLLATTTSTYYDYLLLLLTTTSYY